MPLSSLANAAAELKAEEVRRRLEARPNDVDALNDWGVVLAREKRVEDAILQFQKALRLDPSRTMVLGNLAMAYGQADRLDNAESCLTRLAQLKPDAPTVFIDWGRVLRKLRRYVESLDAFAKAMSLSAQPADVHVEIGATYVEMLRNDDAKQSFQKAIDAKPDHAQAHSNLGILLKEAGEYEKAIDHLRHAVRARPTCASDWNNLGVALAETRQHEEAVVHYHKALSIDPNYTVSWNNLGNALRTLGRSQEAIAALQKALELKSDYAEAMNNIAIAHLQCGDSLRALYFYNKAIRLKPDYAEARMNRALAWLGLGEFEKGWTEYEWRWNLKHLAKRRLPGRRWDGSPLQGKRLLIRYEQGLGDTFQFIRYAPWLKQRGAFVIFEGQPSAREILSRTPGIDQFVTRGDKVSGIDFFTTLLSLPGLFQTRLETIPAPIPYIHPDPAMAQAWKARLESLHGFKVGIAWQGNPQHRGDRQRSVPLEQFKILSQIEGVKLVSLQRGAGCEQIEKLKNEIDLETFQGVEEEADGLLRTAAIIKNLDLLITIDTAVAHLAGAMGVPVWVALPLAADWRWLRDREDSPWYPHMRLFRQHRRNDWTSVFEAIALELQKTAPAPSPPMPRRKTDETVPRLAPTAPPAPEAATSVQSTVQSILPVRRMLQSQFDVGVVMTTIMRPTLKRAVQSIFAQRFLGRIQILLGIDKCKGDMAVLNELQQACPQNCALTVLDLGYSTAARNGGLYPSMPGGALRTILSYAANCRRLAYLDDDNWYAESHLQSLSDSLDRNDWAYSLRWYVDRETQQPLCIDRWESVGPGRGVYATNLGGYVDPNCLMIDKIVCESVLRWWCFPVPADRSARSEDRQVFRLLKERSRVSSTGQATVYYTIHPSDALHAHRTRWISETVHEPLTDDAKPAEAAR